MTTNAERSKLRQEVLSAIEGYNKAADAQDREALPSYKLAVETAWEKYSGQKINLPSHEDLPPGEQIRLESASFDEIVRNPNL